MERIAVVAHKERPIAYQLGECMATLENAGIRDYTARLENRIIFWVNEGMLTSSVKALIGAGFDVECRIAPTAPSPIRAVI